MYAWQFFQKNLKNLFYVSQVYIINLFNCYQLKYPLCAFVNIKYMIVFACLNFTINFTIASKLMFVDLSSETQLDRKCKCNSLDLNPYNANIFLCKSWQFLSLNHHKCLG